MCVFFFNLAFTISTEKFASTLWPFIRSGLKRPTLPAPSVTAMLQSVCFDLLQPHGEAI